MEEGRRGEINKSPGHISRRGEQGRSHLLAEAITDPPKERPVERETRQAFDGKEEARRVPSEAQARPGM